MGRLSRNIEEIKRRYASGESCNSIADAFASHHGAVAEALKRAGVTLRPRYETQYPLRSKALVDPVAADQAERIRYRRLIINSLTKALLVSDDASFNERAGWIIENKKAEIETILAEAAHPRTAGQPPP